MRKIHLSQRSARMEDASSDQFVYRLPNTRLYLRTSLVLRLLWSLISFGSRAHWQHTRYSVVIRLIEADSLTDTALQVYQKRQSLSI